MPSSNSLFQRYHAGIEQLFGLFKADQETKTFLAVAPLAINTTTLMTASYGLGKSTFITLLGKTFFEGSMGVSRLRQTLTEFDVVFWLDIAKLREGVEHIEARPIVSSRLKFINELQRGNPRIYNVLLSLLAEHEVEYRSQTFKSPDFICFADRNPRDTASSEIPRALWDRIDYEVNLKALDLKESVTMLMNRFGSGQYIEDLRKQCQPALTPDDIQKIWEDVQTVVIRDPQIILLGMISGLFTSCKQVDKSAIHDKYRLECGKCEYNGELCSRVQDILGERWKISSIKLAKAKAWYEGRSIVTTEDVLWTLKYTLAHRLQLKSEWEVQFPNNQKFVEQEVQNVLSIKKAIWADAILQFIKVKGGDKDALTKLEELAKRDLVIASLVRWAKE